MNTTRQQYLKTEWNQYPFLETKVFTIRDFLKYFGKLNSGEKKIKTEEFWVAGKIFKGEAQDGFHYTLESQGETLSLVFSKDAKLSNEFSNDEILSTGDHVLIRGYWNEVQVEGFEARVQTLKAHNIQLLAPSHEPYYLDNYNFKRSQQWQYFLKLIRKTFEVLDFTEVDTPSLLKAPGTEPFLEFFKTDLKINKSKELYYLPTSPELHLKKMISAGWCRIYEIKKCFRNNEVSEHHQPEFWMLEWYRAYSPFDVLIKDIQGILNYLKLHWPHPIVGHGMIKVTTVAELFQEHCDFTLTPKTSREDLVSLAQRYNITANPDDSWNDIFFRIFLEKIELSLGYDAPTVVKNYPPSQSALARINPEGWADRFELYWKGLEIANAFHELNDPEEQLRRFNEEIAFRKKRNGEEIPIDEEFMTALRAGFPPTAGIALGLDRLFMALIDIKDISKTRPFYIKESK
jgi:lysyl-tRNA synthetase class 2